MARAERTVAFMGPKLSGKKTLMGNLIYVCGLDLKMMERLEASRQTRYEQIPDFFLRERIPLSFEMRSGVLRIIDSTNPDCVVIVVDAQMPTVAFEWIDSQSSGASEVLKNAGFIVVVINKMDLIQWSQEKFNAVRADVTTQLRSAEFTARIEVVPVAAKDGSNILPPFPAPKWHHHSIPDQESPQLPDTLSETLNRVFS